LILTTPQTGTIDSTFKWYVTFNSFSTSSGSRWRAEGEANALALVDLLTPADAAERQMR
jgi:hypothetical protein